MRRNVCCLHINIALTYLTNRWGKSGPQSFPSMRAASCFFGKYGKWHETRCKGVVVGKHPRRRRALPSCQISFPDTNSESNMTARICSLFLLIGLLMGCKTASGPASSGGSKAPDRPVNDYGINSDPVNATGQEVAFRSGETLDAFRAEAKAQNKPYWLYFYFDACKPCKRLKAYTFSDPRVIELSDNSLLAYKVDVDKFEGMDIAETFSVTTYPTILMFTPDGQPVGQPVEGFVTPDALLAELRKLVP
jgi:thiol:disulfide interchange protein